MAETNRTEFTHPIRKRSARACVQVKDGKRPFRKNGARFRKLGVRPLRKLGARFRPCESADNLMQVGDNRHASQPMDRASAKTH